MGRQPSRAEPVRDPDGEPGRADQLLVEVAGGDDAAFTGLYDIVAPPVFGLVLRLMRDRALAEEVTQEILVELWRTAPKYRPDRGSALTWALTIAHRRAVDRIRSVQASRDRDARGHNYEREFDVVAETALTELDRDQVRNCLGSLTTTQRESVVQAYYRGLTYIEVAQQLKVPLGTIKTRMRDGLIRLRDCLGGPR
ncbi:MAG TPA: ECF RNA polymerase sigma factor SigK [Pseudonocardia sp.]|nr:ECF RNA polymerase sigma factor SigK [Pseudonocardia sp.]